MKAGLVVVVVIAWHAVEACALRFGLVPRGAWIGVARALILSTAALVAARAMVGTRWRAELGLRAPREIRASLPVMGAVIAISSLLYWPASQVRVGLMSAMLMVSVAEELVFRGLLYAIVVRDGRGSGRAAVLITSVMFGISHVARLFYGATWGDATMECIVTTSLGGCLGVLRCYSGSVVYSASCHVWWNYLAIGGTAATDVAHLAASGALVGAAVLSECARAWYCRGPAARGRC